MYLHFLKATDGTPLTKSFTRTADGQYEKTSYPDHLYMVDSTRVEVHTIDEFFAALTIAASYNQALQKGELDRELRGESRASHTLTDKETEWVLFDIDGLPTIETVEEFIYKILPQPFHDVSYIVQYSASHGIINKGLSAHLFFLLEHPVAPADLKNWLRAVNLNNPILEQALTLQQGNKSALKWPLDVTVAGNDKYIYIAPPICTNFEDPLAGKRIQLVRKSAGRTDFRFAHPGREAIRKLERAKIQALRDAESLPKLSLRTSTSSGFDVLLDADPVEVTEWWFSNGFFHLNLNGGDSGAYWVNPKRPKYIHSFKDEPSRILKQVAPEFWKEIKDQCFPDEMLVFRDKSSNKFYAGRYDPIEDEYTELDALTRQNIADWAEDEFNASPPDPIPQYRLVFDPTANYSVDRAGKRVNLFQRSEYMKLAPDASATIPPTIRKVIWWMVGNDDEAADWVINWLAYIFQRRTKTRVALVLHGTKGTGKGVFFNNIVTPLLGRQNCRQVQQDQIIKDQFNEYLGNSLMVMLDESEADPALRNRLFNWITEPTLRLRVAYADGRDIESHVNFILASNKTDAAPIEQNDRRFTVAPRQPNKIDLSKEEINERIPEELSEFARFLAAYKVDEHKATTPLNNEAKQAMLEAARDSTDVFIEALKSGDLLYFVQMLQAAGQSAGGGSISAEAAITRWASTVNTGKPEPVSLAELLSVYKQITGNDTKLARFKSMLIKRDVAKPEEVIINGMAQLGIYVQWEASPLALHGYKHVIGTIRAPAVSNDVERAVLSIGRK